MRSVRLGSPMLRRHAPSHELLSTVGQFVGVSGLVAGEVGSRLSWEEVYRRPETPLRMMRTALTHAPMILPLVGSRRALEVGTGTGTLSGFLAQAGVTVTTLDISRPVMEVAKGFYTRLGVHVECVEADGTKMPFADDSFDAVFSQGLWEHFADNYVQAFAREGLRVAPLVYASVPSVLYPRIGRRGPGLLGNERLMSRRTWARVLRPIAAHASFSYYADWKQLTFIGVTVPYPNHLLIELRR